MTPVPATIARCLTCNTALPDGIGEYCNEACSLKVGRREARARTLAARRRRRRGGRRLWTNVGEDRVLHVTAISTPRYPEWRWRIKGYAGETLEQSHVGFPTTTSAIAAGTERLVERERRQTFGRNTSEAGPRWGDDRHRMKENE